MYKTDQYREGTVVPIVKTGTDHCPWANLLKNLSQAKPSLPTSATGAMASFMVVFKLSPGASLSAQLLSCLTLDVGKFF